MADETIKRQVRERYAGALETGEPVCCPTSYPFEDRRRFVPEEVIGASYGSGTPPGLATVPGPCTRSFVVIHRTGEPVAGEAVACGLGGSCC